MSWAVDAWGRETKLRTEPHTQIDHATVPEDHPCLVFPLLAFRGPVWGPFGKIAFPKKKEKKGLPGPESNPPDSRTYPTFWRVGRLRAKTRQDSDAHAVAVSTGPVPVS